MAAFRKCREDAGSPLHMIAEDPGRLSDVDQVAVTVEYAVQGKGALLALKTLKSKDTNIVLLIGCPLSSDPENMVIARPTQAGSCKVNVLTHLLNRIYQTLTVQASIGFSDMLCVMRCMDSSIISVKAKESAWHSGEWNQNIITKCNNARRWQVLSESI